MFRAIAIALGLWVALGAAPAQAADLPMDAPSTWVNQLGSKMVITISSTGVVSGTYVSAVGCGAGNPYPVAGWYNNLAISFTVNWQTCNSLTSWTGHLVASGSTLQFDTLWYLALGGTVQWNSTVAGHDTFTYQP